MWTSEPRATPRGRPLSWAIALEAVALAACFGVWPGIDPHPGWVAVLLLSARYGHRGLLAGLLSAGTAAMGGALAGPGLEALWHGVQSGPNLAALGGCLAVSWIASGHGRRQLALSEQVASLSARALQAEEATQALRGVAQTLRGRVDRTACSLSFLRDVATRLEGTDPTAAAEAAAELALARTGAAVSAVKLWGSHGRGFLAVRGARGSGSFAGAPVQNAELTVPIQVGKKALGQISLWGLPRSAVTEATGHDLVVIASWCGSALAAAPPQTQAPQTVQPEEAA